MVKSAQLGRALFLFLIISNTVKVKCSYVHANPPNNYFAQQSYFQAGVGGSFGFGAYQPASPAAFAPPPPQFIPQQISPFPNYITGPGDGWNDWWKPPSNELKPSIQNWDTTYNVPCGDYTIHPLVTANLRYSSYQWHPQLPYGPYQNGVKSNAPSDKQQHQRQRESRSFPSPVQFSPFNQFQTTPTSCAWNFKAFGGSCKLKFACTWFQLPALFRCEENYLKVKDAANMDMTFCGSRKPRGSYISSTDSIQLYFHTQSPAALPSVFDCNVFCSVENKYQTNLSANTSAAEATPALLTNGLLPVNTTSILNKLVTAALTPFMSTLTSTNSAQNLKYLECKCGVRNESLALPLSRIVGGTETIPGEFPWTAALVRTTDKSLRPFCGATLINDRWLITAAHCVVPKGRNSRENVNNLTDGKRSKPIIEVLLNPHNITTGDKLIRAQINRILVHSNYNYGTFDYDIALLRLTKPMPIGQRNAEEQKQKLSSWTLLNNAIIESTLKRQFFARESSDRFDDSQTNSQDQNNMVPICLPKPKERSFQDSQAVVTGFGLLREGGSPSETMMQTQVQIFNHSTCTDLYVKNNLTVTGQMLCAGRLNGQMDSCVGDSGGPLLVQEETGRVTLAGIVSWGRGCARPNFPGVYTNVAKFVEWIHSNTYRDSNWCSY